VKNRTLVILYLGLAFGLAWLIALPLWLSDGLRNPWFPLIAILFMCTPALAALTVVFFVERPAAKWTSLGIVPLRPPGRLIKYLVLALVIPPALVIAALPVGAFLGVYPADFVEFSAYKQLIEGELEAVGMTALPAPIQLLVAAQLFNVILGAFLNLIPALGEELGWRGWLLPKLMGLGAVPAILVSGVIWALWHAPLILLGYNYPGVPGWLGVVMMIGMCTIVGAIFSWLRLRSESVWPAALAHGAFNSAAGFSLIFAAAGERFDTVNATILGWSGWILPIAVVITLFATGQFSKRKAPAIPVHSTQSE